LIHCEWSGTQCALRASRIARYAGNDIEFESERDPNKKRRTCAAFSV